MHAASPRHLRRPWSIVLPLTLGLLAAMLVTGGAMLWPTNVCWLQHADLAQSYLGWAFYRHDPWTLPFGATPSYGLEIHSSVYYSDSIPLLAMLLKPVAAWLPEPFQYFGPWVLACFILQAYFAWNLLSLSTDSVAARILGCLFFVAAPPMLMRLGGHMALVAHWAILAALYLYLRPSSKHQRGWWTVLVAASMVIHAYVFLMVAAIWVADVLRRLWLARHGENTSMPWRELAREVLQVMLATAVVAWLAGFFMISSRGMQAEGFGYYKMNLLAPFNGGGWSRFGLAFAQADGEYEGFNYFGVGGLLLLLAGLIAGLKQAAARQRRLWWPLVAVAVGLTLFAITPSVGLGMHEWQLPLPSWLHDRLAHSSIQATGRLFWVSYYMLLVAAIGALARTLSTRWLVPLLGVAVLLQAIDLAPGLRNLHQLLLTRATVDQATQLQGPFWDDAGQRYTRLRLVPTRLLAPGWEVLARYALEHHMGTDAIQVARADWKVFNRVRAHQLQLLDNGTPEPQTLYVLDPSIAERVARAAHPQDAVFLLDGWRVLAPGWNQPLPPGAVNLKPTP
ncbi:DUF6311 domain-containing protein [Dyella sp. C9]|uniref:DUF6311 domain-containing protein n=1 Tax=Dyella sp. C9 TaxID=2202154 RepID=UPI0013005685|nr:DUF6311 domain-containing protein [Dyella sp. C9]